MIKKFISKKIDKDFEKIGLKKVHESNCIVRYEIHEECGDYMHKIDILHKKSSKPTVQSFTSTNQCVGMTAKEMWLCYWKMWCKGWN